MTLLAGTCTHTHYPDTSATSDHQTLRTIVVTDTVVQARNIVAALWATAPEGSNRTVGMVNRIDYPTGGTVLAISQYQSGRGLLADVVVLTTEAQAADDRLRVEVDPCIATGGCMHLTT